MENDLDPQDWAAFRRDAHRMLDDIIDYLEQIRERPVWQPIPDAVRDRFRQPMPVDPEPLESVHRTFMQDILPYSVGNAHPGFMGWVHGGGNPAGMLGEMLAAGLNANLGGRDQIPIEVERQVLAWVREIFGFPDTASGIFVTGTSMANFIALVVARQSCLGEGVRRDGLQGRRLVGYAPASAHVSLPRAFDFAGLGSDALRLIPVKADFTLDAGALGAAIVRDRREGNLPFFVAGCAGTVDTGAIDPLDEIAEIAGRENLWFHVDGAYGALGMLSPDIAPRLSGLERADSVAFDFHKWGQVPYDAGFILVRDGALHRRAFGSGAAYLAREGRALAAGSPWPCDFGPDLSRGFRALKAWFTLRVHGADRIGRSISNTCALARLLASRIDASAELELLAPVSLNVVCFGYRARDPDRVNREIVARLQESGVVAPSTTVVNGRLAIRAAIVNHRTSPAEIDRLVEATILTGQSIHE